VKDEAFGSSATLGPSRTYQLAVTHMDELTLKDPFPVRIVFGELVPR
jgi:hypothetical protein